MIIDFSEQVEKLLNPKGKTSQLYKRCARYVSEHLFSPIRIGEMSQVLGYSRAYLCTCFKQESGMSLVQFIQQKKIAEAKKLLQFTNQELGQISALLGYSSQSHFQTVFKKFTGETPMSYRRKMNI